MKFNEIEGKQENLRNGTKTYCIRAMGAEYADLIRSDGVDAGLILQQVYGDMKYYSERKGGAAGINMMSEFVAGAAGLPVSMACGDCEKKDCKYRVD
jgi:hypothetical protein